MELASGNYGKLDLWSDRDVFAKFDGEVTITSANPDDPAIFTAMKLTGVENLAFSAVMFDYSADSGTPEWNSPFLVQKSSNVTIQNCKFDGDLAEGLSETVDGIRDGRRIKSAGQLWD